jgi:hypothetical protein
MAKKIYTTAQGKRVDMGAIYLQNEDVRAVGNMGVNARGDQINHENKTIESRGSKLRKNYAKQATNVSDTPVVDQSKKLEEDPFGPMDNNTPKTTPDKDDGFSLT